MQVATRIEFDPTELSEEQLNKIAGSRELVSTSVSFLDSIALRNIAEQSKMSLSAYIRSVLLDEIQAYERAQKQVKELAS